MTGYRGEERGGVLAPGRSRPTPPEDVLAELAETAALMRELRELEEEEEVLVERPRRS